MLAGHTSEYVHTVWLVASALGAVALLVLALAYRRLRARAEVEVAERTIAEHDHSS
jgi:hypothetical protein